MELVFGGVIFILGFVLVCRAALQKIEPGPRFFGVMMVIFLVYVCLAAAIVLTAYLFGDFGTLIYLLFLVYTVIETVVLAGTIGKVSKQITAGNAALFIVYLAVILAITVFSREDRGRVVLETDVFAAITEAVDNGSMEGLYHMILNVVLFAPLGYLFAQLHPQRLGTVMLTMGMGCMLSTLIETCQLVFRLGNCDVGDILANTIGALVGLFIFRWMSSAARR